MVHASSPLFGVDYVLTSVLDLNEVSTAYDDSYERIHDLLGLVDDLNIGDLHFELSKQLVVFFLISIKLLGWLRKWRIYKTVISQKVKAHRD